ncbi:pyocin knob domain-containing protein [Butyricicoccus faecihominis]|uniref:pyocin knob domain-containing protein n=1 Tax=Butyricicoccus faecihominis TaxID=1712515 RepID=UPI00247834C1|nr:pyocin knob domain-containing protein [Butyricicoccus faecihominis]MCQ5130643.1 pyocin knob domain-containing protein [Butyricicoccus faecihominis]
MPRDIPFGSNLNNCKVAGEWYCGAGLDATNTPPNPFGETAFGLKVEKTYALGIKQTLFWYYSGSSYYRTFTGEEWTGWVKIATATPLAVYDLPLAAGVQRALPEPCEYRKSQTGRVYIMAWVTRASGDFQEGDIVATLPEGYRPSTEIVRHADCASHGVPNGYCHAHIYPSGGITIAGLPQNANWLMIDAEFWAD